MEWDGAKRLLSWGKVVCIRPVWVEFDAVIHLHQPLKIINQPRIVVGFCPVRISSFGVAKVNFLSERTLSCIDSDNAREETRKWRS